MAFKKIKHCSSGKREVIIVNYRKHLTTSSPYKPLTVALKATGGRNNMGKITTRHIGGGHKKRYRLIDFKRDKDNVPAIVKTIEYDPNRTAFISLVCYHDGEKKYILTPDKIKVGDKILSGENIDIAIGNCLPINQIPEGTFIHNIELMPGKGAQIIRSAGSQAQILGPDESNKYTVIKLPSGELRKILNNCRVVIGRVSNLDHSLVNLGKAGASRHRGIRPTVRGVAMNPNDHVHGGGEGRCSIGRDAPRTPWGKKHMGVRTRAKRKPSNSMIVTSRHLNKKKRK